jgi:hypothetical protein
MERKTTYIPRIKTLSVDCFRGKAFDVVITQVRDDIRTRIVAYLESHL